MHKGKTKIFYWEALFIALLNCCCCHTFSFAAQSLNAETRQSRRIFICKKPIIKAKCLELALTAVMEKLPSDLWELGWAICSKAEQVTMCSSHVVFHPSLCCLNGIHCRQVWVILLSCSLDEVGVCRRQDPLPWAHIFTARYNQSNLSRGPEVQGQLTNCCLRSNEIIGSHRCKQCCSRWISVNIWV